MSLSHHNSLSSVNKIMAKSTENIVLDLSTAATLETSPKESALK